MFSATKICDASDISLATHIYRLEQHSRRLRVLSNIQLYLTPGPRTKHPGFFVLQKIMKEKIDFRKRMREIKFTTENHLTEEQFRKLIDEKYERARAFREKVNQRESKARIFDL